MLSSLGLKRRHPVNPWSALVSPPDFCSRMATALVAAMRERGVPRILAVSAAGVADSAATMNGLMRFLVKTSRIGPAYRDLAVMETIYAASQLDWCCPRPTRLTDGPLTRRVKITENFPVTGGISRADVAWWILEHAAHPTRPRLPSITAA